MEPGGGPRDGADGGHHPRHPGQRLPGPQCAEQVRHIQAEAIMVTLAWLADSPWNVRN